MKTEGGSKRKLSERKDPGASVGCSSTLSSPPIKRCADLAAAADD